MRIFYLGQHRAPEPAGQTRRLIYLWTPSWVLGVLDWLPGRAEAGWARHSHRAWSRGWWGRALALDELWDTHFWKTEVSG